MSQRLVGSVAVVTGAGQGIGLGIAQVLAQNGASVVITDIDEVRVEAAAASLRGQGHSAIAVRQDVSDIDSIESVFAAAESEFGSVNVLVNNAGVAQQKPLDDVSEADWDLTMSLNAKAVFFSCQFAGRYFGERGGGKIVNISSMCGKNAIPEYSTYNTSKFSVIGITQSAALDLASRNINVNAVCPGIVRTPLWDALPAEQWERQVERIPLGRGQSPEDVGNAVAFLASEKARNITGAALAVTGGLQMW